MIAVRVNGPMGEYDIGVFSLEDLSEIRISRRIQLCIAINLPGKYGSSLQYGAGLFTLRRSYCSSLLRRFAWDASFPARQIKDRDVMALVRIKSDRTAAS